MLPFLVYMTSVHRMGPFGRLEQRGNTWHFKREPSVTYWDHDGTLKKQPFPEVSWKLCLFPYCKEFIPRDYLVSTLRINLIPKLLKLINF